MRMTLEQLRGLIREEVEGAARAAVDPCELDAVGP